MFTSLVVANNYWFSPFLLWPGLSVRSRKMQIDAVVIATLASVIITIVVGAVIGYNVIKNMDKKSDVE